MVAVTSAAGLLGGHAYFLHWGVVQISLANLLVILLMVVIFVVALVLPFPQADRDNHLSEETDGQR